MTCSFRTRDHPPIFFDNSLLTETKSHKHLGLTITANLSWTLHIDTILKSVAKMNDVMKGLKYTLDKTTLEQIYFSFIRPKLEYGSHIWDNCNGTDSQRLENLQLEIARTVTGARRGTSHELLMEEVGWPSLADRRKGNILKQFLKIINDDTPAYLKSLIPGKIGTDRPQSRNADNFSIMKSRTETFKNSFIPSAVSLYNTCNIGNRSLEHCKNISSQSKNPLYYHGKRSNNIKHSQLRMHCSKLNHHLFTNHVLGSPTCHCGHKCENSEHFLLHCPLYHEERRAMLSDIHNLCNVTVSCNLLLYGSDLLNFEINCKLFDCVHTYIETTDRL